MTTVLLWGDRWWLPHHKLPIPFPDLAHAADQLAAAWPNPGRTVRIIYQPDDFATIPVRCPNGNRATLAAALAEEHPVVRHPGHVWGFEPILTSGDAYATLLHYETKPALFSLVHRLQEHGFTVNQVWPMATWLNALLPELSPSGAMTICAIHTDRYCLYRQSGDGVRSLRAGFDGDIVTAVASHLAGLPSEATTEYLLYVTTDDTLVERLTERVSLDEGQIIGIFSLTQALAKPVPINPKHPAQLLPPVPIITAPRLISIVSALCLLLAVFLAISPAQAWVANRANRVEHAQEKESLRIAIPPLLHHEAEIQKWQAVAGANAPDPLPWHALLRALSTRLPAQVVLTHLQADREGFQIAGGIVGALPESDWQQWAGSMQPADAKWTVADSFKAKPKADFTLQGLWR